MSNYLDFSIKTRDDIKSWILRQLGHPLITIELADEHLEDVVNESVETFTKYCSQDIDYVAANLSGYVASSGIMMPSNITGIFSMNDNMAGSLHDVNRLFSIPNVMMNAGMLVVPYPGETWGWVSYEMSMQYMELTKRIMGGGFQFEYNPRTHFLKLFPDPAKEKMSGWIVFGVNTIRPDTLQYGEEWVKKFALALAKIILGRVRSKFQGVQLLGGGTLEATVGAEGKEERDTLLDKLRSKEGGVFNFWMG